MNIKQALKWGAEKLKKTHSAKNAKKRNRYFNTYLLDAEILLCEVLKKPKEFLYAYPEKKLTSAQLAKYKGFIARRAKREPVAYIIGRKEFYSFEFLVGPSVLIPRPETETLINAVNNTVGSLASYSIIDVGVGSGAIAITLKKLFPRAQVFGTETSARASALARKNAKRLGADITIKKGDLLSPFLKNGQGSTLTIKNLTITANLPYLSEKEWREAQPEVRRYEPKEALVGGKIGTEVYEELFEQIRELIDRDGHCKDLQGRALSLIIEIGANQKSQITKLLKKYLKPKKIEAHKDLSGKWRVIKARII